MRPYIRSAIAAATVGLIVGAPLGAQDTTAAKPQTQPDTSSKPQTHTVVKGDNLWTLAQTYLGNPFLWPELYRLNRDVVEDPHWIYPGEVIRLRAAEVTVVMARETPEQQAAGGVRLPTVATDTAVAVAPVGPPPPEELPTQLFAKVQAAGNASTGAGITQGLDVPMAPPPTVRAGEVMVAPFVEREGGPRSFGRILKAADLAGIAQATERYRFQPYDRVMIEPPVGNVAPEGERFLAYRLGPILANQGQVMIPTGVVEVTQAPRSGAPAVAKIIRAFAEMNATDRLIPLDTAGIGSTVRPRRVADGPSTTVRWVFGENVLPSIQSYVVLNASSKNGVRVGDEYMLYRPRPKSSESQVADPPVPVGRLQVVRSTPFGVTAVVIGQEQPTIEEGMPARVIARMP
ncbi:MAG: LysM peptidoglycan-binding domain-containing protein [Gemmatimonadota bacterium]